MTTGPHRPATGPLQAYLFADPAAHSLSPVMHRAAFRHAGLPGEYEARRVPPEDLPAALRGLRVPPACGANLSLPHKEAALALMDDLTPAARAIGAVNTVICRGEDLIGENTDAPGLLDALAPLTGPDRGQAAVLGAGGAARAAVWALQRDGWAVTVVNRTLARAEALTAELGGTAVAAADVPWEDMALLVNASSAGLSRPDESPVTDEVVARLPAGAAVYDMVYRPAETRLLRQARAAGHRAENGLSMLAAQARLSFLAWTGADVPLHVFLNAAQAALEPQAQGEAP